MKSRGRRFTQSKLRREIFGTLANGETADAVTLTNAGGSCVKIISYGASIQSVFVPDARGARRVIPIQPIGAFFLHIDGFGRALTEHTPELNGAADVAFAVR